MTLSPTHQRILSFLRSQGQRGSTDNEMSAELGIPLNTLRPRRVELERKGLIVWVGVTAPEGSKIWVVLKEPKRPARKPMTVAKAAEPFLGKARELTERFPDLGDRALVRVVIPLGACRALVKAAGE